MAKPFLHIAIAAAAAAAGCLASCCDSHDEPIYGGDIMLQADIEGSLHWSSSRDGSPDIPGTIPETIGVFAEIRATSSVVFNNQCMYNPEGEAVKTAPGINLEDWEEDVWPYTPTKIWIPDQFYNFYCYAPYNPTNAEWIASQPDYRTFHLHRIPPISATEYAVGKYLRTVESGTRPTLRLTHITSRLRFLFAIGEQFAKLRTIRVTSIKISDSGNGTNYWECEVDLDKNYTDESGDENFLTVSVTKSEAVYVSSGDIELIAENESTDPAKPGQKLETEYKSFTSAYNLLGKIDNTDLTVVYDVYDTADMLLRKGQRVTNRIDLRSFGELERGKCYDVKILVSPKYLYVLSDNDIPPDAVIEPSTH